MTRAEAAVYAQQAHERYRRDMSLWSRAHELAAMLPAHKDEYEAAARVIIIAANRHADLHARLEEFASGRTPWLRPAPDEGITSVERR